MLIVGQNEEVLTFLEYVEFAEAGDRSVRFRMKSGGELYVAKYDSREECRFAIGLLEDAVFGEEPRFAFPHKGDLAARMAMARQHGSRGGGARHGGS